MFGKKYLKKQDIWIDEHNKVLELIAKLDIDCVSLTEMEQQGLGNVKVSQYKKQLSPNSFEMVDVNCSEQLKNTIRQRNEAELRLKSINLLLNR